MGRSTPAHLRPVVLCASGRCAPPAPWEGRARLVLVSSAGERRVPRHRVAGRSAVGAAVRAGPAGHRERVGSPGVNRAALSHAPQPWPLPTGCPMHLLGGARRPAAAKKKLSGQEEALAAGTKTARPPSPESSDSEVGANPQRCACALCLCARLCHTCAPAPPWPIALRCIALRCVALRCVARRAQGVLDGGAAAVISGTVVPCALNGGTRGGTRGGPRGGTRGGTRAARG
jgi:hypothetical protein